MSRDTLTKQFLEQLGSILEAYNAFRVKSQASDLCDVVDQVGVHTMITKARAAMVRISGAGSAYSKQVEDILKNTQDHDWGKMAKIVGVVASLHTDLKSGYLASLQELIHGEVFADFIEMADHLQNEGYKDAAAVLACGTLEAHLRQLCGKNGIAIEGNTATGIQHKKADQMNADLAKAGVYSKLDQKNVTAWLDLRNKAAHGHYGDYAKEQVALLIAGVRDFVTRNPA